MAGIYETRCRRASLILMVVDDFSNKSITDGVLSIQADNGQRPIKKEHGIYVFLDMPQGRTHIYVDGVYYRKQCLEVFIQEGQEGVMLPVRMIPDKQYPIPTGTCCLSGKTKAGQILRFYWKAAPKPWKLLRDYQQGDVIEIFTGNVTVEYRMLYLEDKGERGEFFETQGAEEQKYWLRHPLSSSYKKIGTKIYPVYSMTADEEGEFFLPMAGNFIGKTEVCCDLGNGIKKSFSVEAGKINCLEF